MPVRVALIITFLLGLLLIGVAYTLWSKSKRVRRTTGMPKGDVVYEDVDEGRPPEKALVSTRWRLVGKPDYLVENEDGLIPVEIKSANLPKDGRPYWGHILQLAAYCLLVEEVHGQRPPYGYIRYRDMTVRVPYTDELRTALLDTLTEMQLALYADTMPRSHHDPRRCARCGMAYVCGSEKLSS